MNTAPLPFNIGLRVEPDEYDRLLKLIGPLGKSTTLDGTEIDKCVVYTHRNDEVLSTLTMGGQFVVGPDNVLNFRERDRVLELPGPWRQSGQVVYTFTPHQAGTVETNVPMHGGLNIQRMVEAITGTTAAPQTIEQVIGQIRDRNATADASRLVRTPTGVLKAITGWGIEPKPDQRIKRLQGQGVVEFENITKGRTTQRIVGRTLTVTLDNGKAQLVIPFDSAEGQEQDLDALCWRAMGALDTDCILTLLAVFALSDNDPQGIIPENISEIGRLRGWSETSMDKRKGKSDRTKRQRVRDHFDLLAKVRFRVDDGKGCISIPLLVILAEVGKVKGNRRTKDKHGNLTTRPARLVQINPLLLGDMNKRGRVAFFDRGLLTANPATDAWAVQIAFYIYGRMAQSWTTHHLDGTKQGTMGHTIRTLLEGARIPYESQHRNHGDQWLRDRVSQELQKLADWNVKSIGGFNIEQRGKALDDLVTTWATEGHAAKQTAAASKRIGTRDRRIISNAKPKQLPPATVEPAPATTPAG